MRRRDALIFGGLVATAVAIPPILRRLPSDFDFAPLDVDGFQGFRRLYSGPTTGGADPFAGLGSRLPAPADPMPDVAKSHCLSLFGTNAWDGNLLPVAIFSDFNCPYCKGLETRLQSLAKAGQPIRLIYHEMPLLGQRSLRSARAALAGRFMGVEEASRAYLWTRQMPPEPVGSARMAEALSISAQQLAQEISGDRVSAALNESLSLGAHLGVFGTPATMFGRTLVIGSIKDADIRKLVKLELAEGPIACA